jgi:VWFA-related protein
VRSTALLFACLFGAGTIGQASPDQATPGPDASGGGGARAVFRSAIDLVALNVVVTDRDQQIVSGLARADFIVREDGIPQEVSFFATADVPLDLALLLDTSASMASQMDAVRTAARGFVRAVRGIDRVMVLDIKEGTRALHPLSADVQGALEAIDSTAASGGTGLYNGLYVTLKELIRARDADQTQQVRRQAIVVLSDGRDTVSLLSFDDVMDIARDAGVATYTINLLPPAISQDRLPRVSRVLTREEYSLQELAQVTGARAFFPEHVRDLAGVYDHIAMELSNQYALAYVPKNERLDGVFRRISVEVPDRPGHRIRTRVGYTSRRAG